MRFPDSVLLTKDDLKTLPRIGDTAEERDPMVWVHLFGGPCDWWIIAYDPENEIAFALCDIGLGYRELGDVSLREIRNLRIPPFGLPIERDAYFAPAPVSVFQK